MPRAGGTETGRFQPRKHRPAQHLCKLVQEKHDDRRRQPADRHPALHAKRSRPGGIRHCRHGQQPVRFQVPARTAQKGRDPAVFGREDAGMGNNIEFQRLFVLSQRFGFISGRECGG